MQIKTDIKQIIRLVLSKKYNSLGENVGRMMSLELYHMAVVGDPESITTRSKPRIQVPPA